MKTNKLIMIGIALVAVGLLATGIAFAHYITTPATESNYGPYRDNTGDGTWGGCYDGYYGPYGYQPTPEPYDTQPPQGYYAPQNYGRGCWGR